MVEVLSPGLSQNGHAPPSHDDNVASLARMLLASSMASNQEDKMMSREERHAMLKEISQHQAIKDELNKKRGGWRTPRRGWSITDSPVASSHVSPAPNASQYPAPPMEKQASNTPSSSSISPVPEQGEFAAQEMKHAPHPPQVRRPPLPPPRRSYSVMDYEPPPRTHRPSAHMDIFDLPIELHYAIFDHLDPIDSACLGLTNSHFYDIHRRMHGIVPLSSHRSGPNDLEWAFYLASRRIPQSSSGTSTPTTTTTTTDGQEHARHLEGMRLKGQVYCRKCGHYRCQLYRHLRVWMGPEREYCEVTKKYGRRAPDGAADHCSIKSPKHPHRCGRHSAKPPQPSR
ncbi:f-box domain-containing protein [Colletotrichum truncatum]|uniref:F-box domain-containing protein n=1 Tax=Colletotrichum truncatum TaxID=5467 RepID=A0ACC3ZE77_COLTU|nr:f-box domain-containing protein [Colletotrichum truncatum]KAF6801322.1 f-box domain-containing protein [Colletotrichum truncatum]